MSRHFLFMCHPDHGHVIPNLAVTIFTDDGADGYTTMTFPTGTPRMSTSEFSKRPIAFVK